MAKVFKHFDLDEDGFLSMGELKRAFRALGLKKRDGTKLEVDEEMFKSFDTNGDGKVSLEEFDAGLKPKTRAKIEEKLLTGWTFEKHLWGASVERHSKINMAKVFKAFDYDQDGFLDMGELKRAFRAMGLQKRSGEKLEVDEAMFKSFDTNGDGKVSLAEFEANLFPKTRAKIEEKIASGWKFEPELWKASVDRHSVTNMAKVFKHFDLDEDGFLDMGELKRAFRAIGLKKRDGSKIEVDEEMFKSFDTNGDGKVSLEEFEANLKPKTRAKIEEKLALGWVFDKELWEASAARHSTWNMAKVFKQFDSDADGFLTMGELKRGFRALGLEKRSGEKLEVDDAMFKSFDTNGDGKVSLEEFQANLFDKTRAKIEEKLNAGWTFDAAAWQASVDRHSKWNMAKVFKQFDSDADGFLNMG